MFLNPMFLIPMFLNPMALIPMSHPSHDQEERVPIEPAQYGMVLKLYCEEEMLKNAETFLARTNVTDIVQGKRSDIGDQRGVAFFFL
jgi:hypothetical protein